jgi:DNA modification methylase
VTAINLWDYITKLISTPVPDLVILRVDDPETFDWQSHEAGTVHGIIVTRATGDVWQAEALRVLKPGGHLLVASAGDVDATGTDCVCIAEDTGFEVRDAIFVATAESQFCYTAKAATSEREAGTYAIKEDDDTKRGNIHPTAKPVEIMEWCLRDIPEGSHVVDPFLGSGTTGIACIEQGGLSFTGIELSPDYLKIADARIRHANNERSILEGRAIITSDCDTTPKQRDVDFDDFFGLDE